MVSNSINKIDNNDIYPLVYISCPTYNQSKYIGDTLDGFCMQKTNFPYVCGIIDDSSTDGEQELLKKYIENNFIILKSSEDEISETNDYIKYLAQNKNNKNCYFLIILLKYNHYSIRKSKELYGEKYENRAKYIAICEGDDYWIDQEKLKKQVSFLEENNEYSICHTGFKYYYEENNKFVDYLISEKYHKIDNNPSIIYADGYKIRTCTVLYRKSIFDQVKKIDKKYLHGHFLMSDSQQWILLMQKGLIKYIPIITSVYRLHLGSVTRQKTFKNRLRFDVSSLERKLYEIDHKYIHIPFIKYAKMKMIFIYFYMLYHQIDKQYVTLDKKIEYILFIKLSEINPIKFILNRYLSTKFEE